MAQNHIPSLSFTPSNKSSSLTPPSCFLISLKATDEHVVFGGLNCGEQGTISLEVADGYGFSLLFCSFFNYRFCMVNMIMEGEDGDHKYHMWCWNEGLLMNRARNGNVDGSQGDEG